MTGSARVEGPVEDRRQGTDAATLDLRSLGLAAEAGLALVAGHPFGREGAGFARMTIAAPQDTIAQAADHLAVAVDRL